MGVRMNLAAKAATTSRKTPNPIPTFDPVLNPDFVSCVDLEGVGEGLSIAKFAKSVAVAVEFVTFATPITALIFVPSPLLQHV